MEADKIDVYALDMLVLRYLCTQGKIGGLEVSFYIYL